MMANGMKTSTMAKANSIGVMVHLSTKVTMKKVVDMAMAFFTSKMVTHT